MHEWGMAPPGKKCVLRDTIMCDASMCGDGEGCHDDSPTLLYTGVCSVGSVVSSFFPTETHLRRSILKYPLYVCIYIILWVRTIGIACALPSPMYDTSVSKLRVAVTERIDSLGLNAHSRAL